MTISDNHRALMRAEADRLDAEAAPAREEMILTRVAEMLMIFPAGQVSETVARARARAFLAALADLSAAAIEAGYSAVVRGDVERDHRFAPSPPEFRKICEPVMYRARARAAELRKIAGAHDGAQRASDADRERVAAMMTGLAATMKSSTAGQER